MTTYVCGAIFGPGGGLLHIATTTQEREVWVWFIGWPLTHVEESIEALKARGYRYATVTVTEQAPLPAPSTTRSPPHDH